jgi:uncharacterized protein YndB with AHSA1/START domain
MAEGAEQDKLSIVVEGGVVAPAEVVWEVLTNSDLIALWFMPNDFEPEVGQEFSFRGAPVGDWDGVSGGEVLDADAFWRLRYSWRGGSHNIEGYGHYIDTVLTWTLTASAAGTHIRLEHSGFTPDAEAVYQIMSSENGWNAVLNRLAKVVAEQIA